MYGGRELPIEKSAYWRNYFLVFFRVICNHFQLSFKIFIFIQKKSESKIKWDKKKKDFHVQVEYCTIIDSEMESVAMTICQ